MSWCDKLASTPTVGMRFNHHFSSSSAILDALTPILNKMVDGKKPIFSVGRQDTFGLEITTEDGFQYAFSSSSISIGFVHRLKLKNQSGAYPTVEMISRPQPFTKLLPNVCDRLLEVVSLLIDSNSRSLAQIGIVSTTMVDEGEAPPGILKFIRSVTEPWKANLDAYNFQIVAQLSQQSGRIDRCIHEIIKPEDDEGLATLKFDWQRKFNNVNSVPSAEGLTELLRSAQKDALKYFEELAEGNRFDVNTSS